MEVKAGQIVALVGPSGAGKTTLAALLPRFYDPTKGAVHIDGTDVRDFQLASLRSKISIVAQDTFLFNTTLAANIGYGLVNRRRSGSEIKTRVKELLTLVGLADQETKYPVQLSGGQQQRVALARALATSPGLLLLDEPLSALDARVRVRLRDEIKQLQRRLGVTTIMVTHDQEEALAMADRIVVMNQGVIEQVGTPSDIYRKPASAFVADFVGTMTFLDAEVAGPDRLRFGSIELACQSINGFQHGSAIRIGLRPEEVRVRNLDSNTQNKIETKVATLDFLGAFCRAKLNPEEAPGVTILADFSANLMRDLAVTEGRTLAISLPPESLRLFARA